ncbi:MAG: GNAT family N-acetyltransferase [Actinomycetota bacterium]|nr:GNAT family N-acetyltransferase [Actinomycetota bacterium]
MMELVRPTGEHVDSYVAALRTGWSPDNSRDACADELARIEADVAAYLAGLDDPDALGPPITLPDGSLAERLPSIRRWMWDGEFCGSVGMRWRTGTPDLPPTCLGHLGYAVVPWKRRLGYATLSVQLMLPAARELGLPYIDLTTDADNEPSQRVILANGGELVETFVKSASYGGGGALLFRITL